MSLDQAAIDVIPRSERGKGAARRLRATGLIPGVLYGRGKEPEALAVNPDALRKALKTAHNFNTVLTLKFAGKGERLVMLKDYDKELTTPRLLHADFVEIDLNRAVRVEVPVHVAGKSKGVTDGGILDIIRHTLVVDALPRNIPVAIEIDITELGLNRSIHLHDLKLPEGVKSASKTNYAVVSVVAPKAEKEETPVAAAVDAAAAPAAGADGKAAAPAAAGAKDAKPAAGGDKKK